MIYKENNETKEYRFNVPGIKYDTLPLGTTITSVDLQVPEKKLRCQWDASFENKESGWVGNTYIMNDGTICIGEEGAKKYIAGTACIADFRPEDEREKEKQLRPLIVMNKVGEVSYNCFSDEERENIYRLYKDLSLCKLMIVPYDKGNLPLRFNSVDVDADFNPTSDENEKTWTIHIKTDYDSKVATIRYWNQILDEEMVAENKVIAQQFVSRNAAIVSETIKLPLDKMPIFLEHDGKLSENQFSDEVKERIYSIVGQLTFRNSKIVVYSSSEQGKILKYIGICPFTFKPRCEDEPFCLADVEWNATANMSEAMWIITVQKTKEADLKPQGYFWEEGEK